MQMEHQLASIQKYISDLVGHSRLNLIIKEEVADMQKRSVSVIILIAYCMLITSCGPSRHWLL